MSVDDIVMSLSLHGQPSEPRELAETVAALPDPVRDLRGWPGAVLGQKRRVHPIDAGSGATDYVLICEGRSHDWVGGTYLHARDAGLSRCDCCDAITDGRRRFLVTAPVAEFPAVVLSDRGSLGERTGVKTEA